MLTITHVGGVGGACVGAGAPPWTGGVCKGEGALEESVSRGKIILSVDSGTMPYFRLC